MGKWKDRKNSILPWVASGVLLAGGVTWTLDSLSKVSPAVRAKDNENGMGRLVSDAISGIPDQLSLLLQMPESISRVASGTYTEGWFVKPNSGSGSETITTTLELGLTGSQSTLTETTPITPTLPAALPPAVPTGLPTAIAPTFKDLDLDSCIQGAEVLEGTDRYSFDTTSSLPVLKGSFTERRKLTGNGMQIMNRTTLAWEQLCNTDEQGTFAKLRPKK